MDVRLMDRHDVWFENTNVSFALVDADYLLKLADHTAKRRLFQ